MRLRGGTITVPPLSASADARVPARALRLTSDDRTTMAEPSAAQSEGCSGICPSRARAVSRETAREYFFW